MKFEQPAKAIAALSMLALLAGCEGVPYVHPAGALSAIGDDQEAVTGTNMPRRRANNGTAAKQADKDAIASEVRTQTRNTGQ